MNKFFLKSLTLQGAIVFSVAYILSKFGITVEHESLANAAENFIALAGFVMIIVGRFKAKHELTLKK